MWPGQRSRSWEQTTSRGASDGGGRRDTLDTVSGRRAPAPAGVRTVGCAAVRGPGGRRVDPFATTPDPHRYVSRPATERALAELERALTAGARLVHLTGPPGIGKTLVLHCLGERLPASLRLVRLPYARVPPGGFWLWAASELGVGSGLEPKRAVRRQAARAAGEGGAVVLVVDDAEALPPETLQELRAVLDGEPGLRALLASGGAGLLAAPLGADVPEVRLDAPMRSGETRAYIEARLAAAGAADAVRARFDARTLAWIQRETGGVPLLVNALADRVARGQADAPEDAPSAAPPRDAGRSRRTGPPRFDPPWEREPARGGPLARRRRQRGRRRARAGRGPGWGNRALAVALVLGVVAGLVAPRLLDRLAGTPAWDALAARVPGLARPGARTASPADEAAPTPPAASSPAAPARPEPAPGRGLPAVGAPPPDFRASPPAESEQASPPPRGGPAEAAPEPPDRGAGGAARAAVPEASPGEALPSERETASQASEGRVSGAAESPTAGGVGPGGAPPSRAGPEEGTAPDVAAPPAPAARGVLWVDAEAGTRIEVDGVGVGPTPVEGLRLRQGRHRVVARFADGSVAQRTIDLGEEARLVFR